MKISALIQSKKLSRRRERPVRVAIIGTQGVPASYGGFESLVENMLGENCPESVQYTVICSSKDLDSTRLHYKGARLKYIPMHANGVSSIPYDILSMCRVLWGYDVILILGVSGCTFMPMLRLCTRSRIIVNIDGLEHRRDKWGRAARTVLRLSEALAVKYADIVVADNKGIQDYVTETYGRDSELIAYGGDHVHRTISDDFRRQVLAKYDLQEKEYAITVCRIEPENNSHLILEAFSQTDRQLVFIGNWNHSEWSRNLYDKYAACPNLLLLQAIYDLDILYALRSSAGIYIHGHSAGGTNPSLVEAMHFGIPIIANDVVYNRETTENAAYYFRSADDLVNCLSQPRLAGDEMAVIARRRYTWSHISAQYCALFAPEFVAEQEENAAFGAV